VPFLDLPNGIPNLSEQEVQQGRNSLRMLISELQNYFIIYEQEGFPLGSGLLLVPAVRMCFKLFKVEGHFEAEKELGESTLKIIWHRIPGSNEHRSPYEA
jgi:hypothetical protein